MKKAYKIALLFYFLFLNFVVFAQMGAGPGDEDNTGSSNLEGGDLPTSPINSKLWILIILGILYSFFIINRNRQIKKIK